MKKKFWKYSNKTYQIINHLIKFSRLLKIIFSYKINFKINLWHILKQFKVYLKA